MTAAPRIGGAPLVTLTGDGTWTPPAHGAGSDARSLRADRADRAGQDLQLQALLRLRGLLGDDVEEQIATRLHLPAALGTESADQLLPQSLALLAGTTGDLASYGWRIGPGAGLSWHRAGELRSRMLEASRIALLGFEGDLAVTSLGPLTLAAATFLGSGERTLADRGALRDLPQLLAEGLAGHLEEVRAHVPGARVRVLIRDGDALSVRRGLIPTPSGYRRYPALPAPEIGELWSSLLGALVETAGLDPEQITLAPGGDAELRRTARTAGARAIALDPSGIPGVAAPDGREAWEGLAEAHEDGIRLELVVDPQRIERTLDAVAGAWRELGYGPRDLAGSTLMAHRTPRPAAQSAAPLPGGGVDPAQEPDRASLLTEGDLQALLRAAPAWAERAQG
jgi:hypothetical protein